MTLNGSFRRRSPSALGASTPELTSTPTAGFPEYERPRPLGPDDDPTFLASRQRSDERHEQMLRDWEQQLRERERRLREQEGNASDERGDAER